MRIYIESTIPSYVVARPARDLLQAARQQLTRDWWDLRRALELELSAYRQRLPSGPTEEAGGCRRFHAPRDLHARRITGQRK